MILLSKYVQIEMVTCLISLPLLPTEEQALDAGPESACFFATFVLACCLCRAEVVLSVLCSCFCPGQFALSHFALVLINVQISTPQ